MTNEEREKLIEDMALKIYDEAMSDDYSFDYVREVVLDTARDALAIAERRIREDCAEIARQHEILEIERFYSKRARDITAAILASIPETKK